MMYTETILYFALLDICINALYIYLSVRKLIDSTRYKCLITLCITKGMLLVSVKYNDGKINRMNQIYV